MDSICKIHAALVVPSHMQHCIILLETDELIFSAIVNKYLFRAV